MSLGLGLWELLGIPYTNIPVTDMDPDYARGLFYAAVDMKVASIPAAEE